MRTVQFALHVGKEQVSAELNIPEGERLEGNLVIILAHGLNEMGMHHPVIEVLHDQLVRRGFCTARFNFPYAEKKRKTRDDDKTLVATYVAMINELKRRKAKTIIAGGYSMGSVVATIASKKVSVDGLLLLSFPLLDKSKRPTDTRPLFQITVPTLMVSGTEDELTDARELTDLIGRLKMKRIQIEPFFVQGVGHRFTVPQGSPFTQLEVFLEIVEMVDEWIAMHWY
ncbi:MAG TPA: alpha/beta family hydrolase [Candidatus Nanoarchaeia archaeon]|nr:alpha/beta family hydrolase [Candidatus Nanoarchaeia archaeon]